MSLYYVLEGREVRRADLLEWAAYFESADRYVAKETVGEATVSTVFIGIDHQLGAGPPLVFETMVFGGEHNEEQWRYSTWKQAEAGHQAILTALKDGSPLP